MQQMKTCDLSPGDVMLKASDGSILSKVISLGQNLRGQLNSQVVHAGVMFDGTYIIEAQGNGVSANDLRVQNRKYGYLVYRPVRPNFSQGAGTCAKIMFDIQMRNKNLKYNLVGAVGSLFGGPGNARTAADMDGLLDRILAGKGHPFFCSQFVVYVYQFVAEQNGIPARQLFNLNDAKVSPAVLARKLQGSPFFKEVGYMMPNQR
jgi:hypothetical protein